MIRRFTVIAAVALGLAGCGGGVTYAPVEGNVTSGDKPEVGIQVTFEPVGGKPGQLAVGVTDATGHYTLAAPKGRPVGAIVGSNKVTLSVYQEAPGDEFTVLPKRNIPLPFRDGSRVLDVPAEGIKDANFDLKNAGG
ncbi:hypothetical protein [Pirellulimonas nuda]|uniref:hypothetical protein n=1 Tax=Pirellulimonas nuda TaxID=2528009 RepID=UPI0011A61E41|nr:hypothetical protein [Pirellulimonas nuda]